MSDKISGINNISAYNGRNNQNNNNFSKKQENKENNFDQMLNDMINPNNMKPVTKGVIMANKVNISVQEEKNYTYPIKYFVVPVYYTREHQERVDFIGYIVSKCFVVEEKTNYFSDNIIKHEYKIVVPFNSIVETFPNMNVPIFENKKCINSIDNEKAFDNYKTAKDECFRKNTELGLSEERIRSLDKFEEFVFTKTNELNVDKGEYKMKL